MDINNLDLLNRLSPEELTIFIYKTIFELNEEQIADCRWRFKTSPLDCHRAINRMYDKRRKLDIQDEKISALQEIFISKMGDKFVLK
jgi:hypothetical protein